MIMFVNKIISSIMQIILFAIIPFFWWLITARKKSHFCEWIGLKRIHDKKEDKISFWLIGTSLAFISSTVLILWLVRNVETATSEFAGLGITAIPPIVVYAVFNTSFPEELLFRGFLLKRLSAKFGFTIGNFVQALLFGIIHGLMFFSAIGIIKAIAVILFTGGIAWVIGYINERKAAGSILPGWIIHAAANLVSGICSTFLLIV